MAVVVPSQLNDSYHPTPGEKAVYEQLCKLPQSYFVWYEVLIGERDYRPDFTILSAERGLWILEVKDWSIDAIKLADPKKFVIKTQNKTIDRENPARKCELYLNSLKEDLRPVEALLDDKGRLIVPIDYLVVFPNITRAEFEAHSLGRVIAPDRVALKDELSNLQAVLPARLSLLPIPLSEAQLKAIKTKLRPETTVEIEPHHSGQIIESVDAVYTVEVQHEFSIDSEQEYYMKTLGEGPRLLRGLAGSGKTLVLLMRAKMMVANANAIGQTQRILILCWNVSLANYLRQAFKGINIAFDDDPKDQITWDVSTSSVEIMSFMAWVRDLIDKKRVGFLAADTPNQFEKLNNHLMGIELREREKYDAIFIDEAQDFRLEWIKFLFERAVKGATPRDRNFIISLDNAQRIYRHQNDSKFTWAQIGIPLQGRSSVLRRVYRNSARVWMYAGFVLGNIGEYYQEDGKADSTLWFAPKQGIDPELIHCPRVEDQISSVIQVIRDVRQRGYALRNILIIYARKTIKHPTKDKQFALIDHLREHLKAADIPFDWISEDAGKKASFNWSKESVKISTVHSAKGMDAPVAIIVGAEGFGEDSDVEPDKLVYVALTRARECLRVIYSAVNPVTEELERAMLTYRRLYPRILQIEANSAKSICV